MAVDVFLGSTMIGRVSASGEVFFQDSKVGWVNGNGDVYLRGIPFGWVTLGGSVLDRRLIQVGYIDRTGDVYRGDRRVGRVTDVTTRYYTGGAALLLLLSRLAREPLAPSSEPVLTERVVTERVPA